MSNKFKANGVKILITALNRLINTTPHITLILTGEGLYSKEVKGFVEKMDMSQYVIFTGLLKNPYVPLEICDIYTHITLAEGVSLSLLEAMVMGKPILTTKIGGIPEAINDDVNGILVEPCEEKIVEKIEYLIKNPNQAKKMGDNAKQTARNKFTWEISADLFIDIYKN
jgi:glycosyltransferase involved in cell wall biosynthesis